MASCHHLLLYHDLLYPALMHSLHTPGLTAGGDGPRLLPGCVLHPISRHPMRQRLQRSHGAPAVVRGHSRRSKASFHNCRSRTLQGTTRIFPVLAGVNVVWEGQRLQGGYGEPAMVRDRCKQTERLQGGYGEPAMVREITAERQSGCREPQETAGRVEGATPARGPW